jgi:hypothetical protein
VGGKQLAHRGPGGEQVGVAEGLLDGNQKVIGEYAKKDVRLHALFEVVEDGPFGERALHRAESRLDPREQEL